MKEEDINELKAFAFVFVVLLMLVVSGVFVFLGVSEDKNRQRETPVERIQRKSSIVVIDNCQYLFMENGIVGGNNYAFILTHKGNCTNHIHTYNK